MAAAALAMTLAACGPAKQAAPAAAPPQVAVVTVHHTDVPMQIQLPGRTTAYLTAQVRARVDGVVQERAFKEGAVVRAALAAATSAFAWPCAAMALSYSCLETALAATSTL